MSRLRLERSYDFWVVGGPGLDRVVHFRRPEQKSGENKYVNHTHATQTEDGDF
jgi:hypothetical protein